MTRKPATAANGLDDFTNGLALLLGLDDDKAIKLAELIEDKVKEIGDERYTYRPDPWS
jgi:hypothetical protein